MKGKLVSEQDKIAQEREGNDVAEYYHCFYCGKNHDGILKEDKYICSKCDKITIS